MNFRDRTYFNIVQDLLTLLTGGTAAETHAIGTTVPDLIFLENRPVRRVSFLQGKVQLGEDERIDYRFTERDFELVGTEQNPQDLVAIRFRERGQKPAPGTNLSVNYYPERLKPTPITDINVGSVARTLIETLAREIATQYQQLQQVYDSAFVETAEGSALDKVVALVDIQRLKAGHPVGKVRFSRRSGSPGSITIPITTAISDGQGHRYFTSQEATLQPNQATVEVWVHGESRRTVPLESSQLTVLERAIAGIDRVSNDESTYRATDAETDAQLAARARRAIHATGKGTRDALRFGLEGLPFVAAATLTEYPDPPVPMPGMLRLDVALRDDNPFHRQVIDQRIDELRPAGIYIDRHWATGIVLAFQVNLRLAGSSLPNADLNSLKANITQRLSDYVNSLGPNGTLRRTRLVSLVVQDVVVDATIAVTADGTPIDTDTWPLPQGTTARVNSQNPVTFGPVQFETSDTSNQPVQMQVDADLTVDDLNTDVDSLKTTLTNQLTQFLNSIVPGAAISFDQIATALRNDDLFALVRQASVVTFDQQGGAFVELRDNDPPFTPPANSVLTVRNVTVQEVSP